MWQAGTAGNSLTRGILIETGTAAVVPATGMVKSQALYSEGLSGAKGRNELWLGRGSADAALRKIEEGRIVAENDESEPQEACVKPRRLLSSHDVLEHDPTREREGALPRGNVGFGGEVIAGSKEMLRGIVGHPHLGSIACQVPRELQGDGPGSEVILCNTQGSSLSLHWPMTDSLLAYLKLATKAAGFRFLSRGIAGDGTKENAAFSASSTKEASASASRARHWASCRCMHSPVHPSCGPPGATDHIAAQQLKNEESIPNPEVLPSSKRKVDTGRFLGRYSATGTPTKRERGDARGGTNRASEWNERNKYR
ncbi:hypothetical protein CCUS01_10055 [Colletotrichum cuscutae]|uniref:Uncharacterized protein n=1 Tax=Colletotrichum cuscutae TaxID=1209917 RepID=A0AAI9XQC8_9PEZI|nr:hypothetical protein CCUS01_10055 [Colletotrichum cuscutae]